LSDLIDFFCESVFFFSAFFLMDYNPKLLNKKLGKYKKKKKYIERRIREKNWNLLDALNG